MTLAWGAALGARCEPLGVHFEVWSDVAKYVSVVLYDRPRQISREVPLARRAEPEFFGAFVPGVRAGAWYDFRVDGQIAVDPYARSLPLGVHGPAQVVSPLAPQSHGRRRIDLDANEVFYEIHVGTFTAEGTFAAATGRLSELAKLGITVIELMPIAAFPGTRGWGYDGVGLFAPYPAYGTPAELSAFVDAAHALGLGVVLDVVYNHLGPDGNALAAYSGSYFDAQRKNAWGAAPALEKPAFRQLILSNAQYWLSTFGFDGLRLDATHELEPGGDPHILRALSEVARATAPPSVLIAEDSRNDPQALLEHGLDAVWGDDFHHVLHVLLTHERDGYYVDFEGDLNELAHVIQNGQLFERRVIPQTGKRDRTAEQRIPLTRFLFALQNHDQVGNRAQGERLHTLSDFPAFRAASLLLLFLPATPLLFMGQEWASSAPFLYFSDHHGALGEAVSRGRRQEFGKFAAFSCDCPSAIPDPQAETTFLRSKLDWSERTLPEHQATLRLYRQALELRREDPVLREPSEISVGTEAGFLWVVRRGRAGERLLLFNPGSSRTVRDVAGRPLCQARRLLATHPLPAMADSFELPAASAAVFSL